MNQQPYSQVVQAEQDTDKMRAVTVSSEDAPPIVCPVCGGAGFLRINVPFGHPQFGKPMRCQCKMAEVRYRAVSQTYTWLDPWLGERPLQTTKLESLSFESFRAKANGESVYEACISARDYALQFVGTSQVIGMKNLIMTSEVYGLGKTHLACAVLNTARKAGIGCLYVSGNELFQAIFNSEFDESILSRASTTHLLYVDDLDKMQVKDDGSYQRSTLFTLFNAREVAGLPTIITANETEDWKQWLHGAVLSRLFGHAEIIEVTGKDYRLFGK